MVTTGSLCCPFLLELCNLTSSDPELKKQAILLAKIGAPHGIKGEVRVKPFGDPAMLNQYGKLHDTKGNTYKITRMRSQKTMLVVKFEGINTREQSEALNGVELFVAREKLPEIEDDDEFYVQDLIGLDVLSVAGEHMGAVVAAPNFGAGDMLEIASMKEGGGLSSTTWYLPFTREAVPEIDFAKSAITINPPVEVSERDESE